MLIADVRSHGYYDADSERIAGSIRIEPNNLVEEVKHLPRIARFISTALERAKPPAPVWRVNSRIWDSRFSLSQEACALAQSRTPGGTRSNDDLIKLPTFS